MYMKYFFYGIIVSCIAFSSAKAHAMSDNCPSIVIEDSQNTLNHPDVTAEISLKNMECQRIGNQVSAKFDVLIRAEKKPNASQKADLTVPISFYTIIHSKQNNQDFTNKNVNSVTAVFKPEDSAYEVITHKTISLLIPQNAPYEPKVTLGFVK